MKTIDTNKIHERRAALKAMSKPLQPLVKEGAIDSINEGLKAIYKQAGHEVLNTLQQWNQQGKRVKKGERALLLWAKPRLLQRMNEETTEVDEFDYWPICYVFSNAQVTDGRTE
jgi:hypothetical protein